MALFQSLRESYRRRRAYAAAFDRSYRELSALNRRELSELGLASGDIAQIARDEAERQVSAL